MKQQILVLCAVMIMAAVLRAADPMPPASIPLPQGKNTWKMIFNDEFEGTTWDRTKWTPHADWGGTKSFNSGREHYYEEQIQVHDGVCHLVAEPHPTITDFDGSYKSGEILTCRDHSSEPYKFKFKYGYVEARIKNVNIPGFFGAFWMLPAKTNYVYEWEIDILEVLGHDYYTMHQTYHYRPGLPYDQARNTSWKTQHIKDPNGLAPDMNYSRDYHTFGVDWQEDRLAFYINGILAGEFPDKGTNNANIPRTEGYIIIQQMVENTWIRSTGIVLPNTTISEIFYIDYVRVWQHDYDPSVSIEEKQARREQGRYALIDHQINSLPNPAPLGMFRDLGEGIGVYTMHGRRVQPEKVRKGGIYYIGRADGNTLRQVMVVR